MSTLSSLIKQYLEYLARERRTAATIKNYTLYLERFIQWRSDLDLRTLNDEDLLRYENYIRSLRGRRGGLDKATINCHLVALRNFLKFCARRQINIKAKNPIKLHHLNTAHTRLSKHDVTRILAATETVSDELIRLRDRALLELLLSTGLKISELASLKIKDISLARREVSIESYNSRVLPLTYQARLALKTYLDRRGDDSPHLLIAHDRARRQREHSRSLSARSLQRVIEKYARRAGLGQSISAETLRRYYGARLFERGIDEETVQENLGFTSRQTVQRYLKG